MVSLISLLVVARRKSSTLSSSSLKHFVISSCEHRKIWFVVSTPSLHHGHDEVSLCPLLSRFWPVGSNPAPYFTAHVFLHLGVNFRKLEYASQSISCSSRCSSRHFFIHQFFIFLSYKTCLNLVSIFPVSKVPWHVIFQGWRTVLVVLGTMSFVHSSFAFSPPSLGSGLKRYHTLLHHPWGGCHHSPIHHGM